jgi:hypothetical protein
MVSGSAEFALTPDIYCKSMSECRRVLDISVLRLCNLHSRMPTPKKGNLGKRDLKQSHKMQQDIGSETSFLRR